MALAAGLFPMIIGVVLGTVGREAATSYNRFTFGMLDLSLGLSLVAVAGGLLAVPAGFGVLVAGLTGVAIAWWAVLDAFDPFSVSAEEGLLGGDGRAQSARRGAILGA